MTENNAPTPPQTTESPIPLSSSATNPSGHASRGSQSGAERRLGWRSLLFRGAVTLGMFFCITLLLTLVIKHFTRSPSWTHATVLGTINGAIFTLVLILIFVIVKVPKFRFSAALVLCYIGIETALATASPILQRLLSPLGFIKTILALLASLWIASRLPPTWLLLFKPTSTDDDHGAASQDELNSRVRKVLDDNDFLTALRTSLPKGSNDDGLEHVPYMLHSIDERRRRSSRSARLFLTLTLGFGTVFSLVLIGFAFILIDETLIGPWRPLSRLDQQTRQLTELLTSDTITWANRTALEDLNGDLRRIRANWGSFVRLHDEDTGDLPGALIDFQSQQSGETLNELLFDLEAAHDRLSFRTDLDSKLQQLHSNVLLAITHAKQIQADREQIGKLVAVQMSDVTSTRQAVESTIRDKDERIVALVKRLSLGLVVATFLLAILRYLGSLYQQHHQHVVQAEEQDLLIRKFCVGFKIGGKDPHPKDVLSVFLDPTSSNPTSKPTPTQPDALDLGKNEMVKEILSALLKKL